MEANHATPNNWRRPLAMAVSAGLLAGALAACGPDGSHPVPKPTTTAASNELQLLNGTWNYMPGATEHDHVLSITHTAEAILNFPDDTDPNVHNSKYLPNPPVNLYGTHVEMAQTGNVSFAAELTDIQESATLSFHAEPPVRLDESIVTQPGVDVKIEGATATVSVWGEAGSKPTKQTIKLPKADTQASLGLTQNGDKLTVTVNGVSIALAAQPFQKQVWFGADTAQSFNVKSFTAAGVAGNTPSLVDTSKETLGDASQSPTGLAAVAKLHGYNKDFGTAADLTQLVSNPEYTKFVTDNFNSLTPEFLAKFQNIQPEEGKFQWGELDAFMDFAQKHNMKVHGHTLVFGEAYPQWLQEKLQHSNRQQAITVLQQWITPVLERYKGKITDWDVINEPQSGDDYAQENTDNLWYKAIGKDYPEIAAKIVHQTDPNVKIWINEYAAEIDDDMLNAVLKLADRIKATTGVHVEGIGMQSHLYEDDVEDSDAVNLLKHGDLAHKFQKIAARGYKVRVSELSIAEDGNPKRQAELYNIFVRTCMRAANCTGVTEWGPINTDYQDRPGYFTGDGLTDPGDDAMLYQRTSGALVPRPAFKAVQLGAAGK